MLPCTYNIQMDAASCRASFAFSKRPLLSINDDKADFVVLLKEGTGDQQGSKLSCGSSEGSSVACASGECCTLCVLRDVE